MAFESIKKEIEKKKGVYFKTEPKWIKHGFTAVPNVILHKEITPLAKLLFITLLSYAFRKDFTVVSLKQIRKVSRITKDTLFKKLKELEQVGLLERVREKGGISTYILKIL